MSAVRFKRGFKHLGGSWFGAATLEFDRHVSDSVSIGLYAEGEGTLGEFAVEWVPISGDQVPKLYVFDDAWATLNDFTDLLAKMAEHHNQNITPEAFCDLLTSCGIEDMTEREQ